MLGLTQGAREELCNIAFPLCICRLTLAWISSEISTKLLGMPTHLDRSSFTGTGLSLMPTGHFCSPVSTRHSRHPSPTAFSEFLSPTPTGLPLPTSGRVEISSPNPLSGFVPKQTKGLSAWWTTYIVLHIDSVKIHQTETQTKLKEVTTENKNSMK